MMVTNRRNFSSNSSIVSSASVKVSIKAKVCLKYAIGRYRQSAMVNTIVNVIPRGR